MRQLEITTFLKLIVAAVLATIPGFAAELPAQCLEQTLQEKLSEQIKPQAFYQPVLSTDLDFLRTEARFAEGPAPQRNMAIVPGSDQFRFNQETQPILELKKRLMTRYRNRIVGVQKGYSTDVINAAREQFKMMLSELPEKHPDLYRREGSTLVNLLTEDRLSVSDFDTKNSREALSKLGQMVPADLVFMKKKGDEYHLIGANLAFPTHWSTDSFLGASITEIHSNLGYEPAKLTAFSSMINKILDRTLQTPEVVRRNNWFLELDPRYPLPSYQTTEFTAPPRIDKKNYLDSVFVRSERQTMRGLPKSQVVVFGIEPMVYPVRALAQDRQLATELLDGIKVKLLPTGDNADYIPKVARYLEAELAKDPSVVNTQVLFSRQVNDSSHLLRVEKPEHVKLVPGEAVRVTLDTPSGKATRTLSLASSPSSPYMEFAVKDSDSAFKQAFKSANEGTPVKLELTRTSLEFNPEKPAVMIAGGIGITPFRSFIEHVRDEKLQTPMWLLYGNRDQIAFAQELEAAKSSTNLDVTNVLSRPGPDWQGEKGRMDEAFLAKTVPSLPKDAVYYVVASPQMANDTRAALNKLGIPDERISIEAFPGYEAKSGGAQTAFADPKSVPDKQTVCYCHRVSAGALRDAIRSGASTLPDLKAQTKAATGCGGCECNVMGILQCEAGK